MQTSAILGVQVTYDESYFLYDEDYFSPDNEECAACISPIAKPATRYLITGFTVKNLSCFLLWGHGLACAIFESFYSTGGIHYFFLTSIEWVWCAWNVHKGNRVLLTISPFFSFTGFNSWTNQKTFTTRVIVENHCSVVFWVNICFHIIKLRFVAPHYSRK